MEPFFEYAERRILPVVVDAHIQDLAEKIAEIGMAYNTQTRPQRKKTMRTLVRYQHAIERIRNKWFRRCKNEVLNCPPHIRDMLAWKQLMNRIEYISKERGQRG